MNRPKWETRQIKFDSFNIENGLAPATKADLSDGACYNDTRVAVEAA